MGRERRRPRRATSHATRNIIVLGLVVIVVVVAAVILSAPPGPQFFMTVHVYDAPVAYDSYEQLPGTALVPNSTVTIMGPRNFGPETTPTGILGIPAQIPGGTYTIGATKIGYNSGTTTLVVGTGCAGKQILLDGSIACHVLVRMTKSTST